MNIRALAFTVIALTSAAALASEHSPADRALTLSEMVAQMQQRYPGKVVAIELDDSGDKAAHYHVDMRFPASGIAKLDVDAKSLKFASREAVAPAAGSATLAEAIAFVTAHVPGYVTVAELDSIRGMSPHYDIDIRLPEGGVARLEIDPATRQIAWRNPAIGEP